MRTLCVIPARLASSRLPHKPLQTIANQSLIRIVAERALDLACFDLVVVATDDRTVCAAVEDLDVESVLTGEHRNGTERVAQVARMRRFAGAEIVVNLQGDEPFVSGAAAYGAIAQARAGAGVGTAGAPLSEVTGTDRNTVKVFVNSAGRAVGFSRDVPPPTALGRNTMLHHVGIYAYQPAALARWASEAPVAAELIEGLEQLRPLSYGEYIGVAAVDEAVAPGIDTVQDLLKAEQLLSVSC